MKIRSFFFLIALFAACFAGNGDAFAAEGKAVTAKAKGASKAKPKPKAKAIETPVAVTPAVTETPSEPEKKKILVAYYSYSGNTKAVAEAIAEKVGGDLFEIKADDTYPEDYHAMTTQAKKEIADGYRPRLTTAVKDIRKYDVVFLGSPNWWGTITPQVSSFLKRYDLKGKTVVPFITHGSGGVQNTVADMTKQCEECNVSQDGWVGYGDRTIGLSAWLKKAGF